MTWIAEVRHVLAKDVREHRLPLLVYGLGIVTAVGHALGWRPVSGGVGIVTMVVVLVGMFAAAAAVQGDSPTRSDAFWASHPFRPSAMIGEKIVLAALLLLAALTGQVVALWAYDARGGALASLLADSIPVYGLLLLASMAVAAVVRDLRSFALAVVLVPLATMVALQALGRETALPHRAIVGLEVLGTVGAFALLAWLYRARDARRRTRLAGFALAALAMVTIAADSPDLSVADSLTATRAPIPLTLMRPDRVTPADGSILVLHLVGGPAPANERLALVRGTFVIRLANGSTMRVPLEMPLVDLGPGATPVPNMPGVRWVEPPGDGRVGSSLSVHLTQEQRRAMAAGVASIALEGRMVVIEARPVLTMPLAADAAAWGEGHRIHIDEWSHDGGEPTLTVSTSVLVRTANSSTSMAWLWGVGTTGVLVNPARGEAVPLTRRQIGGSTDGLVLPGPSVRRERIQLVRPSSAAGSPEAPLDDAWLRDARLLIVSQEARGSYPVRVTLEGQARP